MKPALLRNFALVIILIFTVFTEVHAGDRSAAPPTAGPGASVAAQSTAKEGPEQRAPGKPGSDGDGTTEEPGEAEDVIESSQGIFSREGEKYGQAPRKVAAESVEAAGGSAGAAGESGDRREDKGSKDGPLDRRWIIKQKKPEKVDRNRNETPTVQWTDEAQKSRCGARLTEINEKYQGARHSSVQGDTCRTAEYAGAFLTISKICEKECPKDFLEAYGYDDKLIKNLKTLHELGLKRCRGLN